MMWDDKWHITGPPELEDYWDKYLKGRPLSQYLRDWRETPEWVWRQAEKLEDRIVELEKERQTTRRALTIIVDIIGKETGTHWVDADYYDR